MREDARHLQADKLDLLGSELLACEGEWAKIAARAGVHDEDEVYSVLEGVCEVDDERMMYGGL